jgi:biotin carboxyl carrier protein
MEYKIKIQEETKPVEIKIRDESSLQASIDETTLNVDYFLVSDRQIHLSVDGKAVNAYVADLPDGKSIIINGTAYLAQDADLLAQNPTRSKSDSQLPTEITPITPSVVVSVLVKEGDTVEKGQGVIVLSAMKMETTLNAPFNGTVTAVNASESDKVAPGDILVNIEQAESDTEPVEEE